TCALPICLSRIRYYDRRASRQQLAHLLLDRDLRERVRVRGQVHKLHFLRCLSADCHRRVVLDVRSKHIKEEDTRVVSSQCTPRQHCHVYCRITNRYPWRIALERYSDTLLVSIRARISWCTDQVPACSSRTHRIYQECLPCVRRREVHFRVKQVAASQRLDLSSRRWRRRYDYPVRRVRPIQEQHARYPERSIRQAEARSRYNQILYRQRAVSIRRRHAEYHRRSRSKGQRTYRRPRERSEYVVVSR